MLKCPFNLTNTGYRHNVCCRDEHAIRNFYRRNRKLGVYRAFCAPLQFIAAIFHTTRIYGRKDSNLFQPCKGLLSLNIIQTEKNCLLKNTIIKIIQENFAHKNLNCVVFVQFLLCTTFSSKLFSTQIPFLYLVKALVEKQTNHTLVTVSVRNSKADGHKHPPEKHSRSGYLHF